MEHLRLIGLFALVPVTVLLTISFFVLFAVQKTEHRGIRGFGKFAAVMLWICAFLFFCGGTVTLVKGPMMAGPHHMMMKGMCCPVQWTDQAGTPGGMMKAQQPAPVKK